MLNTPSPRPKLEIQNVSLEYEKPDFARIVAQMNSNRRLNLQQPWTGFVSTGPGKKCKYSQHCEPFARCGTTSDVVATLNHQTSKTRLASVLYSGLVFCRALGTCNKMQRRWPSSNNCSFGNHQYRGWGSPENGNIVPERHPLRSYSLRISIICICSAHASYAPFM